MGLFTMEKIPKGTWITSYAPLAPVCLPSQSDGSDFIIKTIKDGLEVEIDGNLCPLGLGRLVQDGTFPLYLASERFSALMRARINCEWSLRDGEIWFKSTRDIHSGEELFTRYTHDNSYWSVQFTPNQLQELRKSLLTAKDGTLQEAERILQGFSFTC